MSGAPAHPDTALARRAIIARQHILPLAGPGRRPWRLSATGWARLLKDLLKVADILVLALAGLLVSLWRFGDRDLPAAVLATLVVGCLLAIIILPSWQIYRQERWRAASAADLLAAVSGWGVTLLALLAILFVMKISQDVSRLLIGAWFVAGSAGLIALRLAVGAVLARSAGVGPLVRQVAVIGTGERLAAVLARLAHDRRSVQVAAVLDLDGAASDVPPGALRLGDLDQLEAKVRAGLLDQVVLAIPARSEALLERTLERLRHLPIELAMVVGPPSGRIPVLGVMQLGGLHLVRLLERPLDGWRFVLKSVEDWLLAALLLVLAAPAMLAVALAVRLDSPGPILFRQHRRGFAGEPIPVLKFRTMHVAQCDTPDAAVVRQATRGDPRVTRVGRFLRRTSLDELPQLINVLRGEMSIVGPRPHAVAHDNHYALLIDEYLDRHKVKPGITGWAQIHGYRGETRTVEEMRKRIELDLDYIARWSLALDVRILALTCLVGFRHARAY